MYRPCHLTNPINRILFMANGKITPAVLWLWCQIDTSLSNFGNAKKRLCLFCLMRQKHYFAPVVIIAPVVILPHEAKYMISYIGGSGLDRTGDFQKFCRSRLDRIQFYRIKIGLGLKNLSVRSSLVSKSSSTRHSNCPATITFSSLTFSSMISIYLAGE